MKLFDWFLVLMWVFMLAFLGPYLISEPSWVAVGMGFALIIGLVVMTVKRIQKYVD